MCTETGWICVHWTPLRECSGPSKRRRMIEALAGNATLLTATTGGQLVVAAHLVATAGLAAGGHAIATTRRALAIC